MNTNQRIGVIGLCFIGAMAAGGIVLTIVLVVAVAVHR